MQGRQSESPPGSRHKGEEDGEPGASAFADPPPGPRCERVSNAKAELNFRAPCSMKLFNQVVHPRE